MTVDVKIVRTIRLSPVSFALEPSCGRAPVALNSDSPELRAAAACVTEQQSPTWAPYLTAQPQANLQFDSDVRAQAASTSTRHLALRSFAVPSQSLLSGIHQDGLEYKVSKHVDKNNDLPPAQSTFPVAVESTSSKSLNP